MTNVSDVLREAEEAEKRFGPMTSTHEGYGVLAEEMAELLDAIRSNDPIGTVREATQVAAVALRLADSCDLPAFRERSGF